MPACAGGGGYKAPDRSLEIPAMEFGKASVTPVSERVITLSESNNLIQEAACRRLEFFCC